MGVIGRVADHIGSKIRGWIRGEERKNVEGRAEDAVERAQAGSDKVSIAAGNAAAQLGKVEALYNKYRGDEAKWTDRASKALDRGDETAAQQAATEAAKHKKFADDLKPRVDSLREAVNGYGDQAQDVKAQVDQARAQAAQIIATNGVEDARAEFRDAVSGVSGNGVANSLDELQGEVQGKQAKNDMMDKIAGNDVERQFAKAEREEAGNSLLEELKKKKAAAAAPAPPAAPPAVTVQGEEWNIR